MPIYNSEKYLKEAIKCLINQTLKDIEIILIDDGSTDNSPQICNDFATNDKRIIVKHIKNGGLCNARNVGLKLAKSKYIMFMDHDDEIDITACEENYTLMKEHKLDMIKFGRRAIITNEEKTVKEDIRRFNDIILNDNEIKKEKINLFYDGVFMCIWDGIYRKDILVDFDTSLKMGGEDTLQGLQIYNNLNKIMLRNKIYYYHFIRDGVSTSTKYNKNLIRDKKKIFKYYQELLGKDDNIDVNKYNMMISKWFISSILSNF